MDEFAGLIAAAGIEEFGDNRVAGAEARGGRMGGEGSVVALRPDGYRFG